MSTNPSQNVIPHTESEYCGVARVAYFDMTSVMLCLLLSLSKHTTVTHRSSTVTFWIFFWMKLPCSIFRTTDVTTKKHEEKCKKMDWCCALHLGARLAMWGSLRPFRRLKYNQRRAVWAQVAARNAPAHRRLGRLLTTADSTLRTYTEKSATPTPLFFGAI